MQIIITNSYYSLETFTKNELIVTKNNHNTHFRKVKIHYHISKLGRAINGQNLFEGFGPDLRVWVWGS